jgi:hypothetical protein
VQDVFDIQCIWKLFRSLDLFYIFFYMLQPYYFFSFFSLHSYFQVSPEMFKFGLWLGHSRTFRDLSRNPSETPLDCVLRVVVLLEGEPLPQSEVLSPWSRFSSNI